MLSIGTGGVGRGFVDFRRRDGFGAVAVGAEFHDEFEVVQQLDGFGDIEVRREGGRGGVVEVCLEHDCGGGVRVEAEWAVRRRRVC